MLGLVIGGATSIPAVPLSTKLKGIPPRVPLSGLPVNHIRMPIAQHRRVLLSLDASGDQKGIS
ncbi:hypothetical protein D3C74_438510 [compost metagenome]